MVALPNTALRIGDTIEVEAAFPALTEGTLELDAALVRALAPYLDACTSPASSLARGVAPAAPLASRLIVRGAGGAEASLTFDAAESRLRGPGLARVVGSTPGPRRLVLEGPAVWRVVPDDPVPRAPIARQKDPAPSGGPGAGLADASLLLRAVREGRFDGRARVELSWEAHRLSMSPGFDRLLALEVARGLTPYEHQVRAARSALTQHRGRVLLCDEVGLGKTIEAGLVALELVVRGLARRILVLTPSSLVPQWREEMREKFLLEFATMDDPGFRAAGARAWTQNDRVIASLDTAKREPHATWITDAPYDLVIVDEAHHLRNRRTVAWKFAAGLRKKYFLMLTATPVQNGLDDLHNLITLLRPGQLHTPKSFRREHVASGDGLTPKDPARLRALVSEVMIRNRRATCGLRFTRRVARTLRVVPTEAEAALYRDVTAFVRDLYGKGEASAMALQTLQMEIGSSAAASAPTLRKVGGGDALASRADAMGMGSKEEALLRLLTEPTGEAVGAGPLRKAIVFTRYRATQERLELLLRERGIRPALLHGDLRRGEKERQIELFRGEAPVLLSTDVGSEGRNLQFCSTVVNYDLPWNPMSIEQRIGRVSRVGQQSEVLVVNLAAVGTIEDRILGILDRKINLFELVVGEVDLILGSLDEDRTFEAVAMDAWAGASSDDEGARRIDELGERLVLAKEEYLRLRRLEDEVLGS